MQRQTCRISQRACPKQLHGQQANPQTMAQASATPSRFILVERRPQSRSDRSADRQRNGSRRGSSGHSDHLSRPGRSLKTDRRCLRSRRTRACRVPAERGAQRALQARSQRLSRSSGWQRACLKWCCVSTGFGANAARFVVPTHRSAHARCAASATVQPALTHLKQALKPYRLAPKAAESPGGPLRGNLKLPTVQRPAKDTEVVGQYDHAVSLLVRSSQ